MDDPLFFFTAVLVLGVLAQWLAWRLRVPSILLLLGLGFLGGYLGGIDPDRVIGQQLLFPVVSLAVATVLFEGGMTLQFRDLKQGAPVVLRLVTLGVVITWALSSVALWLVIGMSPRQATLTGAILSVTGPTVITPMVHQIRPLKRVASVVRWEGIVIDPVGAVLAVAVFEVLFAGTWDSALVALARALVLGSALGLGIAWALVEIARRYWIPDFLQSPVFLAAALGGFTLANQLTSEAGLVTVTALGIALANQRRISLRHVLEFKENLRTLLIACLFIVLAARIRVEDVLSVGWGGLILLAYLVLVVRPLAVFFSTVGTDLTVAERIFLAALAPRGIVAAAVSSVFALEVARHTATPVEGDPQMIVAVTFLVIVGTVTMYGLVAPPAARALKLAVPNPQGILFVGASAWLRPLAKLLYDEGFPVMMVDTNYGNVARAKMEGLPALCANILSEFVQDELDFAGIGRLIAATPNDDLNALAAIDFGHMFGRANVFQLATGDTGGGRREGSSHSHGRYAFAKNMTYNQFVTRVAAGAQFKRTKITDEFTYEDFVQRYGGQAVLLFIITESRQLIVNALDEPAKPKAGQTVIALIDQPASSEGEPAEASKQAAGERSGQNGPNSPGR